MSSFSNPVSKIINCAATVASLVSALPGPGTECTGCVGFVCQHWTIDQCMNSYLLILKYILGFSGLLSFKMSYGGGQKVQKVMVQPINLIFRSRDATFDILRNDAPPPLLQCVIIQSSRTPLLFFCSFGIF